MDSATGANNLNEPFNVTKTDIACPFHDGKRFSVEIGWVLDAYGPMLHLEALELAKHLQDEHGHR